MNTERSVVIGRRRCVRCRYSLSGQPIVHDEGYGLFIVRCPECGGVASMQQDPLLGRWAGFWASALAIGWGVVVAAAALACAGSLVLLANATMLIACSRYTTYLLDRYWSAMEASAAGAPSLRRFAFSDWWIAQDRLALLAAGGGRWGALELHAFWMWVLLIIVAVSWGVFWGVVHLGRRWPGKLLVVLVIGGAATLMAAPMLLRTVEEVNWAHDAALVALGSPILIASLALGVLGLTAGLALARPLARWSLRLTVPDRFRLVLAPLLFVDEPGRSG
jgi:hypothetical protein